MKLTYEQMRHLAELGDGDSKLTIKNKKGQVIRQTSKQWVAGTSALHACTSASVNGSKGSQHHGVRRRVGKG